MKIKDVVKELNGLQKEGFTDIYIATDEELNIVFDDIFYQEIVIGTNKNNSIVICPVGKEIDY